MSGDGHQSIPRDLYPTRMDDHKPHIQSSFDHGNLLYNQPPFHDFFHDPSYRIKGMATSAGSRLFLYTGVPFKEVEMSLDIFTAGCFIFLRGVLTLKIPRTNVASWENIYIKQGFCIATFDYRRVIPPQLVPMINLWCQVFLMLDFRINGWDDDEPNLPAAKV